ncbi:MAG: TonB-dependent receptor [Mariprofundales bacterium]
MNKLLSLVLIMSVLPSILMAQDNVGKDDLMLMSLETLLDTSIITASRHEELLRDTPAHVIVISNEEIIRRRYHNIADVLEDLPSINIHRRSTSKSFNRIIWRGFEGSNKFLIMRDGVRIDSPTGEPLPIDDNYTLDGILQIEIVYGPASSLYGADAFAGVINLISDDWRGFSADLASGSFTSKNMVWRAAGINLNDWLHISAGGHMQKSHNASLSNIYPVSFPSVSATTFAGNTILAANQREAHAQPTYSNSHHVRVLLGSEVEVGSNRHVFRHYTSVGNRPKSALYSQKSQWNTDISSTYMRWRHDFSSTWSGETLLTMGRHEIAPETNFTNIFTDFSQGYKYMLSEKYSLEQQWTLDAQSYTLIMGIGTEWLHTIPTPDTNIPYNVNVSVGEQGFFYAGSNIPMTIYERRDRAAFAYAQWRYAITDGSITLGSRIDKNSHYGNSINPRLGLVYSLSKYDVVKFSYGESFRAPSQLDSFESFGSAFSRNQQGQWQSPFYRIANPNLRPEKARTLETSWYRNWSQQLDTTLSAYHIRVHDIINTAPTNGSRAIAGAIIKNAEWNINIGTAKMYGVDISYNYHTHWQHNWEWKTWGSYSYFNGQINVGNGQNIDMPYTSHHQLKIGVRLTYKNYYFTGIRMRSTAKNNSNRNNKLIVGGKIKSPGYMTLDSEFGIENILDAELDLYLDVRNATNLRYYAAGSSSSAAFQSQPQQPRSFQVSLHYGL